MSGFFAFMTACDGCRECRNGGGTLGLNSGDAFPRLWWRFRESRLSRCVSCPRCGSCRRCPSYAPAGNSRNPERPLCQAVAELFRRGCHSRLRNRQPRLFPLPTMAVHQNRIAEFSSLFRLMILKHLFLTALKRYAGTLSELISIRLSRNAQRTS